MPSTRNVSRTSANLNGIHNARFAGLPLADTDGRGRGAARAAVKNRDGLFIRLQEGEREGWGEISPLPGFSVETLEEAQMALLAWAQAWRDGVEPPLPRSPPSRLASAARRRSLAADYRRPRIIARRRSAPAIRMSYSPDWRRCPARRSLRSKLASGRRSATVWWSICCWRRSPTCSCGSMPTAPGRRSKRNSSPNTLIRRTASALLFLKNLAKRGRILGPLAARQDRYRLDESLREADFRFVAEPGVRAVVIKPTLTGSLQKVQQQVAAAHALGLSVVISSSIESSLGLTQLARIAAWLTPQTILGWIRCR